MLSGFYEEISDGVRAFCEGELRRRAEEDFEACEDPKKRFFYPSFCYTLEGRIPWEDRERDWVAVRLDACLGRKGGGEILARGADAHVWHRTEGCLIPPQEVARVLGCRRLSWRERKKADGVLMDGGKVWLCMGGEWTELPPRRKQGKNIENQKEMSL